MKQDNLKNPDIKFCPACGYEGSDFICPVCEAKMVSQENELERIKKKEEQKDLIEEGDTLSLETAAEKEEEKEESGNTSEKNQSI